MKIRAEDLQVGDEILVAWGSCRLVYAKVLKLPCRGLESWKVSCNILNPGNYNSPQCETDITKHNSVKYLNGWKHMWLVKRDGK